MQVLQGRLDHLVPLGQVDHQAQPEPKLLVPQDHRDQVDPVDLQGLPEQV